MRDPRIPRGEPQPWPGGSISPRVEQRTPMRTVWVELPCPSCRVGKLVATGEVRETGHLHACSAENCGEKWLLPTSYPHERRELDATGNLLRG